MQGTIELSDAPPTSGSVEQRAAWWGMLLAELIASDAQFRGALPSGASYVILPENDDEVARHNLRIASVRQSAGADVIKITVGLELEQTEKAQTYVYRPSFESSQPLRV